MNALERQLLAAADDVLLNCLAQAEALALELDPAATYPDEWLMFRISGLRPEAGGAGAGTRSASGSGLEGVATTLGSDVLHDLPALVERLCVKLGLTEESLMLAGGVRATELAKRWQVSRKTLDRFRRKGLLARRGTSAKSKHVLVFMPETIAGFERAHSAELSNAGKYSRLTEEEQENFLAQYEEMRQESGASITAAAKVIAERHGRSVEGVRLFLKRQTRKMKAVAAASAIVSAHGPLKLADVDMDALAGEEHGPINERTRRVLLRASRPGLDLANLSKRFDRTRPAVRRAVTLAKAEAMWAMRDQGHLIAPIGPTFTRPEAADVLLQVPMVRQGLGGRGETDLLDLVNSARQSPPPTGAEEKARLIAYQFIRFDVAKGLDAVDRLHPKAPQVDHLETMLRWAARLKAEIIRPHLRLILQTIEGRVGRRAEEVRPLDLARLFTLSIRQASHAIDLIEGTKAGRVAGPVGLAVDKAVAEWMRRKPSVDANPRRAASLLTYGTAIPDWTLGVAPWQRWLEPDPRLRQAAEDGAIPRDMGVFLGARFGWSGAPPMTLEDLAVASATTPIRTAMLEQACLMRALGLRLGKEGAPAAEPTRKVA